LSEKGEGQKLSTTVVAKMVSKAWKALPEDEREKWEEMARQDKARYEMEKSMYSGPWKVAVTKRLRKDPKAPKRPMSAFLFFSNSKRAYVKSKHKDSKNAEVSRILAKMWKDADTEEKKPFVDEEFALRQQYKIAMAEWKRKAEEEIKAKRDERENEAMKAVREGKLPIRYEDQHSRSSSHTDSSVSTSTQYSTKMANDTFAPSVTNPYPPVMFNYSFSSSEYSQHNQQQQQQQQYPPATSSHYYPDQQTATASYSNNANSYRNPYGGVAHQAPSDNPSSYDSYGRRYEGGNATATAPATAPASTAMGYDTYGQPHPYGYAQRAYYQQQSESMASN